MDKKVEARHIIPAVCYALLFSGFVILTALSFALDFSDSEALQNTAIFGLLILALVAVVRGILIIIGVGGAVMLLFPLVFSTVNIFKKQRKLTISCMVFDVLLLLMYLPPFLLSLSSMGIPGILVFGGGFALSLTALITNIYQLKKGKQSSPQSP